MEVSSSTPVVRPNQRLAFVGLDLCASWAFVRSTQAPWYVFLLHLFPFAGFVVHGNNYFEPGLVFGSPGILKFLLFPCFFSPYPFIKLLLGYG